MVLAALLPLVACGNNGDDGKPGIAPGGTGSTRTYDVRDFDAVRLSGSDDVDVRVGGGFSVRAEGDPKILDRLKITRDGRRLTITRRWSSGSGTARVYVTLPALTAAAVDGSGDLRVDQVRGAAFDAGIAGSGNLTVAQLAVAQLRLAIDGSGAIAARGEARQLAVQSNGSGDVDAPGLTVRTATVQSSGSGDVHVAVRGTATVQSNGSGDVDLGPDSRCTVRKAGSGDVRCGG
jgi:hypothetical protein